MFITIAPVSNLFGVGEVANPLAAHTEYDKDARVAALVAKGAGHPAAAQLVKDRCTFREVVETLAR